MATKTEPTKPTLVKAVEDKKDSTPPDPHEGMEPGTPHTHDEDGTWQAV